MLGIPFSVVKAFSKLVYFTFLFYPSQFNETNFPLKALV